jgi:hypothetical protein
MRVAAEDLVVRAGATSGPGSGANGSLDPFDIPSTLTSRWRMKLLSSVCEL